MKDQKQNAKINHTLRDSCETCNQLGSKIYLKSNKLAKESNQFKDINRQVTEEETLMSTEYSSYFNLPGIREIKIEAIISRQGV